jgi:hypothetical protein
MRIDESAAQFQNALHSIEPSRDTDSNVTERDGQLRKQRGRIAVTDEGRAIDESA